MCGCLQESLKAYSRAFKHTISLDLVRATSAPSRNNQYIG
jgi:hypothetical protein